MTEYQQKLAERKWRAMLANPEDAHNVVSRGGRGGSAPICAFLIQKILENDEEFFSKMLQKELKHKVQKDSKGKYVRYGYFKSEHGDKKERKKNSRRREELDCIELYKKYIDVVIDRQTPLEDRSKINPDLLLYDKANKILLFGEAKVADSNEPLLRAVIEIERYFHFADHKMLIDDFKTASLRMKDKDVDCFKVQKAILIYKFSFKENAQGKKTFSLYDQLTSSEYKKVQELMRIRHIFAIDADILKKEGRIQYFDGFGPKDYDFIKCGTRIG